jgi:hypothetical protein
VTRFPGHGLAHEGLPFLADTDACPQCRAIWADPEAVTWTDWAGRPRVGGSEGHGLCACGWTSEHLPNRAERRRAFDAHKASLRVTTPPTPSTPASPASGNKSCTRCGAPTRNWDMCADCVAATAVPIARQDS